MEHSSRRHEGLGGYTVAPVTMDGVAQHVSSDVFVGRATELASLRAALDRARSGEPATVVVAGEAGVGKSRLVAELTRQARELDALTLTGGCFDVGDGVVPYAPIVEALRPLTALLEPAELERVLGSARVELARLVPDLEMADLPAGALPPGRLFELLLGALHRLADGRAVLLLIEDVHWADRSTRDLLDFLIHNLSGGIALVITYRSDELHRRHPLRPFLAELERSGRTERLDVGRLDQHELTQLLGGILGTPPTPSLADEIWARSDGNPFFAEELVAARDQGVTLPDALRDVLLARVETLAEGTQRVLQVAAVMGRQVDHALLAQVTGLSPVRLTELLREAVTHHVLVVADDREAGYAFRHALVQEAVYDDLLPMQRVPLHGEFARALVARAEQSQARASAALLGQIAYHWYAAQDVGEALVASVRAGKAAEAASAPAEAERHYQRALGLWEQEPAAAARSPLGHTALLRHAADALLLIGDTDGAVKMMSRALAETDPAIDPLLAGALLERLARYHHLNGDSEEAMAAAQQAVATVPATPPSPERARALAAHGQMLMVLSRMAEARDRCEEAVAVARQTGARAEEGHALTTLGCAIAALGHVDEGIAHLDQAFHIASDLRDPYDVFRARFNLAELLTTDGRLDEAVTVSLQCADLARQFGMTGGFQWALLTNGAEALVHLGRWDEAERFFDDTDAIAQGLAGVGRVYWLCMRALLRLRQGDLAAARADLDTALDEGQHFPNPQFTSPALSTMASVATWEGRPEEARAIVARGLELMAGVDESIRVILLCLAGLEAEAATAERAGAAHDAAALESAAVVAAQLLRRAHDAASADGVAPTAMGRVMLLTAEAHHSRVTGQSDPDRWAEAATGWEDLDCPWPAAYARWREAEAHLTSGDPRDRAAQPLRRAWSTASALRARLLVAEIEALGRRARIDLAGPAATQETGPTAVDEARRLGLTPREREVLALIAEGQTNRQIAEILFISDSTASVHVSHILAKLGVPNRAGAAVAAHRLGIGGR